MQHPLEKLRRDWQRSAKSMVEQHGVPETSDKLEVLPGVSERTYVPALGRQVTGEELTAVLQETERECSHVLVPRKEAGRTGELRPYKAAGRIEFAHGQLRLDAFLAMRWGQQEGLPDVNGMLDAILERAPTALKAEYGEGLNVRAACLHPPNPYMEEELAKRGWRGVISDPKPSDKIGRNNFHVQLYMSRVEDEKFTTEITLFSHAGNSVISGMQLRELGVDVDGHKLTKFASQRERAYRLGFESKGKKGKALSMALVRLVDAKKLTMDEAIAKAVATDVRRKEQSWSAAKAKEAVDGKHHAGSLAERNQMQVAVAEKAKAIDLFLARWFTREVDRGLRELDPRYGELLDQAPAVMRELKRRQMADGHKVLFNEHLTLWERSRDDDRSRKRDEERDAKVLEAEAAKTVAERRLVGAKSVAETYGEASRQLGLIESALDAVVAGGPVPQAAANLLLAKSGGKYYLTCSRTGLLGGANPSPVHAARVGALMQRYEQYLAAPTPEKLVPEAAMKAAEAGRAKLEVEVAAERQAKAVGEAKATTMVPPEKLAEAEVALKQADERAAKVESELAIERAKPPIEKVVLNSLLARGLLSALEMAISYVCNALMFKATGSPPAFVTKAPSAVGGYAFAEDFAEMLTAIELVWPKNERVAELRKNFEEFSAQTVAPDNGAIEPIGERACDTHSANTTEVRGTVTSVCSSTVSGARSDLL